MKDKAINERTEDIIKWMNYGIPRGKTIPIFEDMVEELLKAEREQERERILKMADKMKHTVGGGICSEIRDFQKELQALTDDKK